MLKRENGSLAKKKLPRNLATTAELTMGVLHIEALKTEMITAAAASCSLSLSAVGVPMIFQYINC